jgi:hypothetical protein
MKKTILGLFFLISASSFASDTQELIATNTVKDFIFSVANNSGGINIQSNWNNLIEKMGENANQNVVEVLMNIENFDESIMRIMMISLSAQTLIRLTSGPKIIKTFAVEGITKFYIKPYESDLVATYETTCVKKQVKGWFGIVSLRNSCQVSGIEFPSAEGNE